MGSAVKREALKKEREMAARAEMAVSNSGHISSAQKDKSIDNNSAKKKEEQKRKKYILSQVSQLSFFASCGSR